MSGRRSGAASRWWHRPAGGALLVGAMLALCISAARGEWPRSPDAPPEGSHEGPFGPRRPVERKWTEPADLAGSSGIHKHRSPHLILYTDLPAKDVAGLNGLVEQIYPEWLRYFGRDIRPDAEGRRQPLVGFLMADKERFRRSGCWPPYLEDFVAGKALGWRFWVADPKKRYDREHLVLHEATHSFMVESCGGLGAPWYQEGLAEYFGTHASRDGKFRVGIMPASPEEIPWGRVDQIRRAVGAGEAPSLEAVLHWTHAAFNEQRGYEWAWGLCLWLDQHPRYQQRFRGLARHAADPQFDAVFRERFAADWTDLSTEWQAFVHSLDYGYDVARCALELKPAEPLQPGRSRSVQIDSARGWQSAGVVVEAGREYQLRAEGKFALAVTEKTWWSGPGGITFRYVGGRPLGELTAAVGGPESFGPAIPVGARRTVKPDRPGTLFLRVNDAVGELGDNRGSLSVTLEAR